MKKYSSKNFVIAEKSRINANTGFIILNMMKFYKFMNLVANSYYADYKKFDFITLADFDAFSDIISNFLIKVEEFFNYDVIIEPGGGDGKFASKVLKKIKKPYYIIERRIPEKIPEGVEYIEFSDIKKFKNAIIFSNEFFDSLPQHIYRFGDTGFLEGYYTSKGISFLEASGGDFLNYFNKNYENVFSYSDEFENIYNCISHIERTIILTIDYGITENLLEERGVGIKFIKNHRVYEFLKLEEMPFDVSIDVNFSLLKKIGEKNGFETRYFGFLNGFLINFIDTDTFSRHGTKLKFLAPNFFGECFFVLLQTKGARLPEFKFNRCNYL